MATNWEVVHGRVVDLVEVDTTPGVLPRVVLTLEAGHRLVPRDEVRALYLQAPLCGGITGTTTTVGATDPFQGLVRFEDGEESYGSLQFFERTVAYLEAMGSKEREAGKAPKRTRASAQDMVVPVPH